MRFKLSLILLGITTLSFGAIVEQFDFGPSNNVSSISTFNYDGIAETPPEPRHIGGTDVSGSAYNGWNARLTEGAELGTAAEGSTRYGVTAAARTAIANNGSTNAYYGATTFDGVPWVAATATPPEGYLTNGYYIASSGSDEVLTLTLKVTDIDFSTTTGNSNNNAAWRYTVWDKATQLQNGRPSNQTGYIGLQIMDSSASDRLQLALISSNGTILSGGQAVTGGTAAADNIGYNRTRIGWLTSNGTLTDSTDYTFTLDIDLAAGSWSAQINDQDAETGTFETDDIQGIDRYQTAFTQWSTGDYIDLDQIAIDVSAAVEEPEVLQPVSGYYTTTQGAENYVKANSSQTENGNGSRNILAYDDTQTILHTELASIFHTNGNLLAKFANVPGESEWNWTNNVQLVGDEVAYVASTETLVGTNASPVTSAWKVNEAESVKIADGTWGYENKFGPMRNNNDLFAYPADNDVVSLNNGTTTLNIDSVVNIASISGNSSTNNRPEGAVLTVKTGGVLNVLGQSVHSGQTYKDGSIEIGGWGQAEGTHHMTLNADGGTINAELIRVAHSRSGGTLNVTNNGSIATTDLVLGFDPFDYGVGTVNLSSGDITAKTIFVGRANEGIMNIDGGSLKISSDGRVRIGDSRSNTTIGALNFSSTNLIGKGTVNMSAGEISPDSGATNVSLWVGYQSGDNIDNGDVSPIMANFNMSGGTINAGEELTIQVGRLSPGTMTLSGTGVINASSTITVGHTGDGILNIDGGVINLSDNSDTNVTTRFDVGGHGGNGNVANGTVNMSAGTLNLASLYMSNSQAIGDQTSSFNQTGGTVTIKGGNCRLGVRGEATYTIGGGDSLASLLVNPGNIYTNISGDSLSTLNLSFGASADLDGAGTYKDSTLTINSNGLVHVNTITMDSVNQAKDDDAQATLNLNGGTLLIEGNYVGAMNFTNNATLNISEGELIWAQWREALSNHLRQAFTNNHINLTGGITTDVPTNWYPVFTQGDYTLYGETYNSDDQVYSSETRTNATYSRFVSVLDNPPSPYDTWAEENGITDPEGDEDSDGIKNLLEFAFGTSPASSDTSAISSSRSGTNIRFTHPKREGVDHGLTYIVQTNGNLKFGDWDDYSSADPTESGSSITHSISTGAEDELFIRLKVETE